MRPARDANIPVRVKNSYNPQAPGTLITSERDMSTVIIIVNLLELFISGTLSPGDLLCALDCFWFKFFAFGFYC